MMGDDSPTESDDFSLSMMSITIPAGDIPSAGNDCATVVALNDTILEGSEDFSIAIGGTDLAEVSVGMPNTTAVTITDADGWLLKPVQSSSLSPLLK